MRVYDPPLMKDVSKIADWLVRGAQGAANPVALLQRMCPELVEAGIPLARAAAFVRTLHPHIMGRRFTWVPGEKVVITEASYTWLSSPDFLLGPVARVVETGVPFRARFIDGGDFGGVRIQSFIDEGFTDYIALPMTFISGQVHPITLATKHPEGFSDDDIQALDVVLQPLSRMAEIFALQRTAATLLNTYVGRNAGERIMAGQIKRGDIDSMRAVIWFSDLRGFTSLADQVPPAELIAMLNDLFECQVPAIEKFGGEVLKFIGDGLLAIFPIDPGGKTPEEQTEAALAASDEALASLAVRNQTATSKGGRELKFGLALHLGDIAYGNIGGSGRLDFTCIGTAVNVAARLEGIAGKMGKSRVISADIAKLTTRTTEALGEVDLKGVALAQTVFGV